MLAPWNICVRQQYVGLKTITEKEAWDYFKEMKTRRWDDLTPELQYKLVKACIIMEFDCGSIPPSDDQIRERLRSLLPVTETEDLLSL